MAAVVRVVGTVRAEDGWPVEGAVVTLLGPDGAELVRSMAGVDGGYDLRAEATGLCLLVAVAPAHQPKALPVQLERSGAARADVTLASLAQEALPEVGDWAIDPVHSTIEAVGRHIGVSRVRGSFRSFSGHIEVAEPIERSCVEVVIDAASIDTRNADRDAHLRSADFLDVARFPTLHYQSTGLVSLRPAGHYRVDGRLRIRDVTRPVSLDTTYRGHSPDPWGGERMALSATTELSRDDFGMTWSQPVLVGVSVLGLSLQVELEIEALRA